MDSYLNELSGQKQWLKTKFLKISVSYSVVVISGNKFNSDPYLPIFSLLILYPLERQVSVELMIRASPSGLLSIGSLNYCKGKYLSIHVWGNI